MPPIDTARGVVFYADHRDPLAHRPISLLIHGAGGTHLDWPAEIRRMPEANVIAIDLPGHGRSPGDGQTTVGAYAADIVALLDALDLQQAIVVGHSMGGAIAQTIALEYPGRVKALALIGTGAKLSVHPDILDGLRTEVAKALDFIVGGYFGPEATDSMRRRARQILADFDPLVLANDYAACNAFDVREELVHITQPTLIMAGSDDRLTPLSFSEYMQQNISNSRLELIEGSGHMMMIEQPVATADVLRRWLLSL